MLSRLFLDHVLFFLPTSLHDCAKSASSTGLRSPVSVANKKARTSELDGSSLGSVGLETCDRDDRIRTRGQHPWDTSKREAREHQHEHEMHACTWHVDEKKREHVERGWWQRSRCMDEGRCTVDYHKNKWEMQKQRMAIGLVQAVPLLLSLNDEHIRRSNVMTPRSETRTFCIELEWKWQRIA